MKDTNHNLIRKLRSLNQKRQRRDSDEPDIKLIPGCCSVVNTMKIDNQIYVLKKVHIDKKRCQFQTKYFFREITEQNLANHGAILPLEYWSIYDIKKKNNTLSVNFSPKLATKLCEEGNLTNAFQKLKNQLKHQEISQSYLETQKFIFAYGIARGMRHLHNFSILHRDLKNENVFVKKFPFNSEYLIPLVADLGFAKVADHRAMQSQSCGTCLYLAPEALTSTIYSFPVDVYSYAVILSNIFQLSEKPEYFDNKYSYHEFLRGVQTQGVRPNLKHGVTQSQKDFLAKLWQKAPAQRPTFTEIVHQFENINDNDFMFDVKLLDLKIIKQYKKYLDNQTSSLNLRFSKSNNKLKFFIDDKENEISYRLDPQEINLIVSMATNASSTQSTNAATLYSTGRAFETNIPKAIWFANRAQTQESLLHLKVPAYGSNEEKLMKSGILAESVRNFEAAERKYRKAAKLGYAPAVGRWGSLILQSSNDITDEEVRNSVRNCGIQLLEIAAQVNDKDALYRLAYQYNKENNLEEAGKLFTHAAVNGHPDAWYQAGSTWHQIAVNAYKNEENVKAREYLIMAKNCYEKAKNLFADPVAGHLNESIEKFLNQDQSV